MSLESQIEILTDAINNLAFIIKQQAVIQAAPAPVAPVRWEPTAKGIAARDELEAEVKSASVEMPAPPFMVAAPKAPFSDAKGLMAYMMAAWETLGPVKGLEVQAVMAKLGHKNVSDIKAEDYDALFAGVEALK